MLHVVSEPDSQTRPEPLYLASRRPLGVDAPFTVETVAEWAEFFDGAVTLVNCSIGEPFMMRDIDRLMDAFGDRGKALEITTNGQILTDRNIAKLLGRRIQLYVSLDAATAQTYAEQSELNWERGGHTFNYVEQLLPLDELVRVSGQAAGLAEKLGLDLADQMDFGRLWNGLNRWSFELPRRISRPIRRALGKAPPEPAVGPKWKGST